MRVQPGTARCSAALRRLTKSTDPSFTPRDGSPCQYSRRLTASMRRPSKWNSSSHQRAAEATKLCTSPRVSMKLWLPHSETPSSGEGYS